MQVQFFRPTHYIRVVLAENIVQWSQSGHFIACDSDHSDRGSVIESCINIIMTGGELGHLAVWPFVNKVKVAKIRLYGQ